MKKLTGYAKFEDGTIVTDEDIFQMVKKHSRLIDRLNPRKMIEMTFEAFNILNGSVEVDSPKENWKF